MGDADGVLAGNPAHPVGAVVVAVALGAAAEAHEAGLVGVGQFPGPAALEPFVGDLHLPAVPDQLVEDAKFVADAVASGRDLKRCQGFEEAGRQPAQAAVAQARLLLDVEDLVDVVDAKATQGLGRFLLDAEHQQVVAQLGPDQEFGREVGDYPGRGGADRFNPRQVAGHQPVAHGVAQRHVEVVAAGGGGQLSQRVEEVTGQAVEDVVCGQTTAVGFGVAARRRQAQVAGLEIAHRGNTASWASSEPRSQRQFVTFSASMPCWWA